MYPKKHRSVSQSEFSEATKALSKGGTVANLDAPISTICPDKAALQSYTWVVGHGVTSAFLRIIVTILGQTGVIVNTSVAKRNIAIRKSIVKNSLNLCNCI